MNLQPFLQTDRLFIDPLIIAHDHFIFELLNTEGWITYIGNRNITSPEDARVYIQKIQEAENIEYWVVQLKSTGDNVGIVTFIKRDSLEHHDIGFAFLPRFCKKGFAYEATNAVLNHAIRQHHLSHILAITVPANIYAPSVAIHLTYASLSEISVAFNILHLCFKLCVLYDLK